MTAGGQSSPEEHGIVKRFSSALESAPVIKSLKVQTERLGVGFTGIDAAIKSVEAAVKGVELAVKGVEGNVKGVEANFRIWGKDFDLIEHLTRNPELEPEKLRLDLNAVRTDAEKALNDARHALRMAERDRDHRAGISRSTQDGPSAADIRNLDDAARTIQKLEWSIQQLLRELD